MELSQSKMPAFGIDLSDLSIKIAQVIKKGKSLILITLSKEYFSSGLIENGIIKKEKELIEIIKKTVAKARGKRIKTKYVICSLPEENAFIKTIKIPKVKEEDVERIIKWQIEPNFPVRLEDVYFDWRVIHPFEEVDKTKSKTGQLTEQALSVAVIPKDIVNSYLSVFCKAGFQPIIFEIESMAVVRSLILNGVSSYPVIIIDIGKRGTGLTIFSGGTILFTSHISISGQDFDRAISRELKVSLKEAEDLKKEIGLINIRKKWRVYRVPVIEKTPEREVSEEKLKLLRVIREEKIFDALIPILTDLAEQVRHFIDYFKEYGKVEYVPDGIIRKVLLCGGESNLIGLTDFLSSSLKLSVELGDPLINILRSPYFKKDKSFSRTELLPFTTAIGLAIRGAREIPF